MEDMREPSGVDPTGPAEGMSDSDASPPRAGVGMTRRRRSIWEDPVVRMMGFAAAGLVILYLAAIVSALYFGLIGNTAPRTVVERDLVRLQNSALADTATADQVQLYVLALVADKQYATAKQVIDQTNANESIDQTRGEQMLFCTAEMQRAQGQNEEALATYDAVMSKTNAAYEKEYEEGGEFQNWALAYGLHENYYLSALSEAKIYGELGQHDKALEKINIFLEKYPREAGVIADRGDIKLKLGDTAGAEADYREALKYVPDYAPALEALEKMGVGGK